MTNIKTHKYPVQLKMSSGQIFQVGYEAIKRLGRDSIRFSFWSLVSDMKPVRPSVNSPARPSKKILEVSPPFSLNAQWEVTVTSHISTVAQILACSKCFPCDLHYFPSCLPEISGGEGEMPEIFVHKNRQAREEVPVRLYVTYFIL